MRRCAAIRRKFFVEKVDQLHTVVYSNKCKQDRADGRKRKKKMLMTKLKNRILRESQGVNPLNLTFELKNVSINGNKVGCSGFVTNTDNGVHVYVNTEQSAYGPLSEKVLYRTARHTKDWTGGRNRWGKRKDDEFVKDIITLLRTGE